MQKGCTHSVSDMMASKAHKRGDLEASFGLSVWDTGRVRDDPSLRTFDVSILTFEARVQMRPHAYKNLPGQLTLEHSSQNTDILQHILDADSSSSQQFNHPINVVGKQGGVTELNRSG